MRKLIFVTTFLFISFNVFSQEDDQKPIDIEKQNELKINGLFLVIGAIDLTYERILNEESALGISVFLPFDEEIKDDINYYVSPYYRFYFGKKYASGFFAEGFGMLNSTKSSEVVFFDNQGNVLRTEQDDVTDFALGIGIGGKWVTNRGFLAELSFGVGRNLFNTSELEDEFVGKVGITLGFRF